MPLREGHPFRNTFGTTLRRRASLAGAAPSGLSIPTTNLLAHFKMATGITIATGVSSWADQSGNGYDLVQATTTMQPAYASGIVTFDGTDDWLKDTTLALSQPYTIYMLARQVTWADNDRHFDGIGALSVLRQTGLTPGVGLFAAGASVTNNDWAVDTNFYAVCCVFNGASSEIQIASGGTPTTGASVGSTSPTGFALGAGGAGTNASNLAIKELAIYSAGHTGADRLAVMQYLESL